MLKTGTDPAPKEDPVIRLARQGNRDAFRQLYLLTREQVYRRVFRYAASPQGTEDIMQEAFIKAFRGITGFSAWITRISDHCAIRYLR